LQQRDKKSLTSRRSHQYGLLNSNNEVSLANTKVNTKKYEQAVKRKVSECKKLGQHQHLTKATIDLKLNSSSTSAEQSPVVNHY
jgi:hypothetical protein